MKLKFSFTAVNFLNSGFFYNTQDFRLLKFEFNFSVIHRTTGNLRSFNSKNLSQFY